MVCVCAGRIEGKKCRRYNIYSEGEERGEAESVSTALTPQGRQVSRVLTYAIYGNLRILVRDGNYYTGSQGRMKG